jgi:hypothetical protein
MKMRKTPLIFNFKGTFYAKKRLIGVDSRDKFTLFPIVILIFGFSTLSDNRVRQRNLTPTFPQNRA